jgi:endoplasmic reticulum-Golgi intermediate compartment protein 2
VSLSYLHHYREHAEALTARQAIAESRKSRGFLSGLFRRSQDLYKPTYNHVPDGSACRIYGSLTVKKVTGTYPCYVRLYPIHHSRGASLLANLHITTVGHGYSSNLHVDHNRTYHHFSRPVRQVIFHSHEPFTRHHRILLWQTFPRDYPTP